MTSLFVTDPAEISRRDIAIHARAYVARRRAAADALRACGLSDHADSVVAAAPPDAEAAASAARRALVALRNSLVGSPLSTGRADGAAWVVDGATLTGSRAALDALGAFWAVIP